MRTDKWNNIAAYFQLSVHLASEVQRHSEESSQPSDLQRMYIDNSFPVLPASARAGAKSQHQVKGPSSGVRVTRSWQSCSWRVRWARAARNTAGGGARAARFLRDERRVPAALRSAPGCRTRTARWGAAAARRPATPTTRSTPPAGKPGCSQKN